MTGLLPEGLLSAADSGTVIRLHLQPRASATGVCGIQGDELKVRVTAPPVDDAANQLCIALFAKLFKTAKSNLSVISGQKSRHKRLYIAGAKPADAAALIASLL